MSTAVLNPSPLAVAGILDRMRDYVLPMGAISVIFVMLIPLPAAALDLLLALSMAASINRLSDIGSLLPHVISGAAVVSIVMSLPTTGPMLLDALRSQDMFLAGSFLMFMAFLTVIGVFLSDLALAALDPRIRLHVGRQQ